MSPSNDSTTLDASEQAPEGVRSVVAEERFEEYSPGLDKDLLELIQASADIRMAAVTNSYGPLA